MTESYNISIPTNPDIEEFKAGNVAESYNLAHIIKNKKGDAAICRNTYHNPKFDTVYYQNSQIKHIDDYFRVNPANASAVLAAMGRLDLQDIAINQRYVQFEAIIAKSAISVDDDLLFVHGDSKPYPFLRKAKIFQYGVALNELDYRALMSGSGAGGSLVRAKVEAEIQASYGRMIATMETWMHGYTTTFASTVGYDSAWTPCFKLKAATGTATDPEDVNSVAGTITTQSYNMTGTNKSKDFVLNTIAATIKRFDEMYDSNTREQMLRNQGNTYTMMCHPSMIKDLDFLHPTNGTYDMSDTYGSQIRSAGVSIIPSLDTDASYANTEDGSLQYIIAANMADNFKIGFVSDYTIEDWTPMVIDGYLRYTKRAWVKALPWTRPYYISGSWKKAAALSQFVYMNDAA